MEKADGEHCHSIEYLGLRMGQGDRPAGNYEVCTCGWVGLPGEWSEHYFGVLLRDALGCGAVILKDQLEPVSGRQLLAMARNIVNQVLDEAETSVEKRQAINDHCDVFALSVLARVPVFVLREGETP